jgi:hypothetical protein
MSQGPLRSGRNITKAADRNVCNGILTAGSTGPPPCPQSRCGGLAIEVGMYEWKAGIEILTWDSWVAPDGLKSFGECYQGMVLP